MHPLGSFRPKLDLFVILFSIKETNRIMDKLTAGVVGTFA